MPAAKPPVIILTGPTATGKTATAIRLASDVDIDVINGDSRLFYRGMDIGTAKPSKAERAIAPHHLIDTLDPRDAMSLAQFQDQANALIVDIHARNRLPVIVGGTQQYINAVIEGWQIPRVAPQPELRAQIQADAEQHGRESLLARLKTLDPAAAASAGLNTRRIMRALEVITVTGRPMSELQGKRETTFSSHLIALSMPRTRLYERIDARVHTMVEAGLVEEVASLLDKGISPDTPAFSGIGYRQVIPYLQGDITLDQMIERIQHDTHRLVRHQETWLRKSTSAIWINVSEPGWYATLRSIVEAIPGVNTHGASES